MLEEAEATDAQWAEAADRGDEKGDEATLAAPAAPESQGAHAPRQFPQEAMHRYGHPSCLHRPLRPMCVHPPTADAQCLGQISCAHVRPAAAWAPMEVLGFMLIHLLLRLQEGARQEGPSHRKQWQQEPAKRSASMFYTSQRAAAPTSQRWQG